MVELAIVDHSCGGMHPVHLGSFLATIKVMIVINNPGNQALILQSQIQLNLISVSGTKYFS